MAGPAGLGELWRAQLPLHAVLCRLREEEEGREGPSGRAAEACGASLPRDQLFGLDGDLLLWGGERGALFVLGLRGLGGQPEALGRHQA